MDGTRATAEVGRTVIGLVVGVDSHTGCSWRVWRSGWWSGLPP